LRLRCPARRHLHGVNGARADERTRTRRHQAATRDRIDDGELWRRPGDRAIRRRVPGGEHRQPALAFPICGGGTFFRRRSRARLPDTSISRRQCTEAGVAWQPCERTIVRRGPTMTRYRLHYFPESGNSYKLALMLTLCGQEFEPIWTDFGGGVTRTKEWRQTVNDMDEIPVLEESGMRLTQTAPILLRLAERDDRFRGGTYGH